MRRLFGQPWYESDETVPTAVSRRQAVVVTGEKNIARLRQMLHAAARRRGA